MREDEGDSVKTERVRIEDDILREDEGDSAKTERVRMTS